VPGEEKGSFVAKASGKPVKEALFGRGAVSRDGKLYHPDHGVLVEGVFEKMSKSRGNVVNPDEVVSEFGADALRVYEMFMGPLERTKPWQTSGLTGVRGFLDKVYQVVQRGVTEVEPDAETAKLMHRSVKKVSLDIERLSFNTAVSQMMIYTNHLASLGNAPRRAVEGLLLCLAPFAPHLAEELWSQLGHPECLALEKWPSWDERQCEDDVVEVPVQVNGKVRGRVSLPKVASEDDARALALQDEKVQAFLAGKELLKVVYVPGRVLNFTVK
jgi:leucyl-tRNA synthetase